MTEQDESEQYRGEPAHGCRMILAALTNRRKLP